MVPINSGDQSAIRREYELRSSDQQLCKGAVLVPSAVHGTVCTLDNAL